MLKKKIIIWGTTNKSNYLYHYLNFDKIEVIGFTDNKIQEEYIENFMFGIPFIKAVKIIDYKFDFIVISSSAYLEITNQLYEYGIDESQIIQANNINFMIPDTLFYFNNVDIYKEKYEIFLDMNCFACNIV